MSHVFISHAEKDRPQTERLCELLASNSIQTWVSFRDIRAGTHWDEEIETALGSANAVVVLATVNSVQSRYVRAEVEGALSEQLTVVPVIIGDVSVPLRWRALQSVLWNGDADATVASQICRALPPAAQSTFASQLEDPTKEIDLRNLILAHPEWLPIEFNMHLQYRYLQNAETSKGCFVDCFAARMDSSGPRAYLYFLGSPYAEPFDAFGAPTPTTHALVERMQRHVEWLTTEMSDQHPLAPNNFLGYDVQWRFGPTTNRYKIISINALIGRRRHFERDESNNARFLVASPLGLNSLSHRVSAELISYDRVLESVRIESEGRSAWYRRYLRESDKREQ